MAMIYVAFYLFIGAIYGLLIEEIYFQNSSEASREPKEYFFSALFMSIIWPMALLHPTPRGGE